MAAPARTAIFRLSMTVRLAGQIRPRTVRKLFADRHEIDCGIFAASVHLKIELQAITFIDPLKAGPFDCADMHKRIRLAVIPGDETKSLGAVEEFDSPGGLLAGQLPLRGAAASTGITSPTT